MLHWSVEALCKQCMDWPNKFLMSRQMEVEASDMRVVGECGKWSEGELSDPCCGRHRPAEYATLFFWRPLETCYLPWVQGKNTEPRPERGGKKNHNIFDIMWHNSYFHQAVTPQLILCTSPWVPGYLLKWGSKLGMTIIGRGSGGPPHKKKLEFKTNFLNLLDQVKKQPPALV